MSNNTVQLTGYLGGDAKAVLKDGNSFTVLNLATKSTYRVKQGDETIWKETETQWHDVFIFNPSVAKIANDLKKGDKAEIIGSISYSPFKDENGYTRKQAFIKGYYIDKLDHEKRASAITQKFVDDVVNNLAG